ncbi:MAG: hypothetical protein HGA67_04025 [Candidatus Yonathbacteria bacterium]|nr:hypothetical protein [Candidatus Yonathbacteria bacterium]
MSEFEKLYSGNEMEKIEKIGRARKMYAYEFKDYPRTAEIIEELNVVGFDEAQGFHQGEYIRVFSDGDKVYLVSFENYGDEIKKIAQNQSNKTFPSLNDYVNAGVNVITHDITEVWKGDMDALQEAEYARHSEKWNGFRESIAGHPAEDSLKRIMWDKPHVTSVSNNSGYHSESVFYVKFNGEELPIFEAHETVMTVGTREGGLEGGSYAADYIGAVKKGDKIEWSYDGKTWEEVTI